jgi:hypothetical protein
MAANPKNMTTMMIQILQSKRIGLNNAEAAAEVIAADARFNLWVVQHMKKEGVGKERWTRLLDSLQEVHDQCEAAVDAFIAGGTSENLQAALVNIRRRLDALRE